MSRKELICCAGIASLLCVQVARADVMVGQKDTFQDLTTDHWVINLLGFGNPAPGVGTSVVNTGGPAGAGDAYLKMVSTGKPGAGGRLVALNVVQWTGNYLADGVTAIAMDLDNLGKTDLSLRLQIEGPLGPSGPINNAVSTVPFDLPAGSGWVHEIFSIDPGSLTATLGTVDGALSNAIALRIFNNPNTDSADNSSPIAATLGVDNITAIPEPATGLLVLSSAGLLALYRAIHSREGQS